MFLEGRHFSIACGAEGYGVEISSVETEPTDFALMIYQLLFQLVNFKTHDLTVIVGQVLPADTGSTLGFKSLRPASS